MTLIEIASLFEARKGSVIDATGLDKDALHIYFGLALFLTIRLVWRWRGGWIVAWLAVIAMACGGEWLDMTAEVGRSAIQPDPAHWHDIWNTAFWPTVLLIVGRWLQPKAKVPAAAPEPTSGEDAERRFEQA
ncbi:hypothetical protein [Sphingopyxis sp. USTB-05]|jgi:hypothetical protein|uniref:hypothetical protein n=1 Tax=Sphingopyxis sp. USTB-05 TaxID=2830667 RepID=UPI0020789BAF|nr:hypothetical protein [Sphingopyxis sp. USTB-05]USI76119.1 hypothetical protein KEC45_15275 [Sphingopyxis sp. USTB-05]